MSIEITMFLCTIILCICLDGNFSKLSHTYSPEMLEEMKNAAIIVEDTGVDLPQSFYDVIAKAEGRL